MQMAVQAAFLNRRQASGGERGRPLGPQRVPTSHSQIGLPCGDIVP